MAEKDPREKLEGLLGNISADQKGSLFSSLKPAAPMPPAPRPLPAQPDDTVRQLKARVEELEKKLRAVSENKEPAESKNPKESLSSAEVMSFFKSRMEETEKRFFDLQERIFAASIELRTREGAQKNAGLAEADRQTIGRLEKSVERMAELEKKVVEAVSGIKETEAAGPAAEELRKLMCEAGEHAGGELLEKISALEKSLELRMEGLHNQAAEAAENGGRAMLEKISIVEKNFGLRLEELGKRLEKNFEGMRSDTEAKLDKVVKLADDAGERAGSLEGLIAESRKDAVSDAARLENSFVRRMDIMNSALKELGAAMPGVLKGAVAGMLKEQTGAFFSALGELKSSMEDISNENRRGNDELKAAMDAALKRICETFNSSILDAEKKMKVASIRAGRWPVMLPKIRTGFKPEPGLQGPEQNQ
ncbi:MAG: hypothetical protein ABIG11_05920 [bacterium]